MTLDATSSPSYPRTPELIERGALRAAMLDGHGDREGWVVAPGDNPSNRQRGFEAEVVVKDDLRGAWAPVHDYDVVATRLDGGPITIEVKLNRGVNADKGGWDLALHPARASELKAGIRETDPRRLSANVIALVRIDYLPDPEAYVPTGWLTREEFIAKAEVANYGKGPRIAVVDCSRPGVLRPWAELRSLVLGVVVTADERREILAEIRRNCGIDWQAENRTSEKVSR